MFVYVARTSQSTNTFWSSQESVIYFGIMLFLFCGMIFDLSISSWWILFSQAWFEVGLIIQGEFTITSILFDKYGLMNVSILDLIVSILMYVSMMKLPVIEFHKKENK